MALVVGLGIAFQAPGAHADTVDLEVDAVTYRVDPDAPGQGATLVGFNRAKIARNLTSGSCACIRPSSNQHPADR